MREEFLLDALVDYQIDPEDPTRTIPNPERKTLDNEIRAARAEVAKLERELGAAAAANAEHRRPTMRGFKIAHRKLGKQLRNVRADLSRLLNQRRLPSALRSERSTIVHWSSSPRNASI